MSGGHSSGRRSLAGSLAAFRQAQRRRLRIWVIDDEVIYAEGIRNLIKDAPWFEENVEIVSLREEAMVPEALEQGPPDACICDIDLGGRSPDGFAVTRELRRRGLRAVIYIHSNRSVPQDYRHAIEVGADAFLPKPMSRPHLVRLLDETIRVCAATSPSGRSGTAGRGAGRGTPAAPRGRRRRRVHAQGLGPARAGRPGSGLSRTTGVLVEPPGR